MLPRKFLFSVLGFLLVWFGWKTTATISRVREDLLTDLNSNALLETRRETIIKEEHGLIGSVAKSEAPEDLPFSETIESKSEEKTAPKKKGSIAETTNTNNATISSIPDRFDLLTHAGRTQRLEAAKTNLRLRMQELYGQYYESIFEPDGNSNNSTIGKHWMHKSPSQLLNNPGSPVQPNSESKGWNGLVRKIKIKLLQVQLGILGEKLGEPKKLYYAQYLWMTGGDILAAGFGNLFHQSYTWVLQDAVQEAFASQGIEFIARNHGIREKQSAPETALCASAIYGREFDSIVWDFRVDGKHRQLRALYAHRIALASNRRPALFHHGEVAKSHSTDTIQILSTLEELGMPVLTNDPVLEKRQQRALPDSVDRTFDEVKAQLPPNLQFIKCGNGLEKNHDKKGGKYTGSGDCTKMKFDVSQCPGRGDMLDWNPGWKMHALKGFSYAMTMLEILSAAVDSLGKDQDNANDADLQTTREHVQKQLEDLLREEEEDCKQITTGDHLAAPAKWIEKQQSESPHFNFASFFRSPALCRTPLMPSDSRLRGILSDNPAPYGEGYEQGLSYKGIKNTENPIRGKSKPRPYNNSTQLEIVSVGQERGSACPEPGIETTNAKSFRDFYFVTSMQGWRSVTIPNSAEEEHLIDSNNKFRNGWIFLCFLKCTTKTCTEQMILSNTPKTASTVIEMEVNGVPVVGYVKPLTPDGNCRALQHDDGDPDKQFIWAPNDDGRYDMRIRIQDFEKSLYSQLRISSIVLM